MRHVFSQDDSSQSRSRARRAANPSNHANNIEENDAFSSSPSSSPNSSSFSLLSSSSSTTNLLSNFEKLRRQILVRFLALVRQHGRKFLIFVLSLIILSIITAPVPPDMALLKADARQRLAKTRFYIPMNFFNSEDILPRFTSELFRVIDMIGPERCFVSIWENGSKDKTKEMLSDLQQQLDAIGVGNHVVLDDFKRPNHTLQNEHRIEFMAFIRNKAMEPLYNMSRGEYSAWDSSSGFHTIARDTHWISQRDVFLSAQKHSKLMEKEKQGQQYDDNNESELYAPPAPSSYFHRSRQGEESASLAQSSAEQLMGPSVDLRILFFNDIVFQAEDIFDLIFTKPDLSYDMTCAMDFYETFYDRYVTRDVNGESFSGTYPYVLEPVGQAAVRNNEPFDVFSCWNGVVVMRADPFTRDGLRFRHRREDECDHSECLFICQDLRDHGYTNILINPRVKVTYTAFRWYTNRYFFRMLNVLLHYVHWPQTTPGRGHLGTVPNFSPTAVDCYDSRRNTTLI